MSENNSKRDIDILTEEVESLKEKLRLAESKRVSFGKWLRNYLWGYDVRNLNTKNEKKNRINNTLIGALIGVGIGVPITFYILNYAEGNYEFIIYSILIAIFSIGIFLLIFVIAKRSILRNTFNVEEASYKSIADNVFNGVQEIIPESLENVKKSTAYFKEASKELAAYISYSRTRNTLLGLFIALIAGYAGYLTTMLLISQNELIKEQNTKIDTQINLDEANRRSSLVFLFSNVMDKIDAELTKNEINRNLSPQLIGRVISLSKGLKPYKYLSDSSNEIKKKAYSPERSQLFINLVESNIDKDNLSEIFNKGSFSNLEIHQYKIKKLMLNKDIILDNSAFLNLELDSCVFQTMEIDNSHINNIEFKNCKIKNMLASGVVYNNAHFENNNIVNIEGDSIIFKDCLFRNDTINHLEADYMSFKDTYICNVSLERLKRQSDSYLKSINFENCYIDKDSWKKYFMKLRLPFKFNRVSNIYDIYCPSFKDNTPQNIIDQYNAKHIQDNDLPIGENICEFCLIYKK